MLSFFSVIRFVPSAITNEAINIGSFSLRAIALRSARLMTSWAMRQSIR